MEKLLPCPFCGSEAELHAARTIYPHVVCKSAACEACGPALYAPECSVAAWNTRTDTTAQPAVPSEPDAHDFSALRNLLAGLDESPNTLAARISWTDSVVDEARRLATPKDQPAQGVDGE